MRVEHNTIINNYQFTLNLWIVAQTVNSAVKEI